MEERSDIWIYRFPLEASFQIPDGIKSYLNQWGHQERSFRCEHWKISAFPDCVGPEGLAEMTERQEGTEDTMMSQEKREKREAVVD